MGKTITAERDQTNVPAGTEVTRDGVAVTGLTIVVRVYLGNDLTLFLDHTDGVYKAGGHTTPFLTLSELGFGFYTVDGGINIGATTIPGAADHLLLAYDITVGGPGSDTDTVQLVDEFLAIADKATLDLVETEANAATRQTAVLGRFTGVEGAGFLTGTDSLEAIRDRGDAAWTTAAISPQVDMRQSWSVAQTPAPQSFNGLVALTSQGEKVTLPGGALCTFVAYDKAGVAIPGFSGSGVLRTIGGDTYLACAATLVTALTAGDTVVVFVTITGSGLASSPESAPTHISVPEF